MCHRRTNFLPQPTKLPKCFFAGVSYVRCHQFGQCKLPHISFVQIHHQNQFSGNACICHQLSTPFPGLFSQLHPVDLSIWLSSSFSVNVLEAALLQLKTFLIYCKDISPGQFHMWNVISCFFQQSFRLCIFQQFNFLELFTWQ